MSTTLKRSLHTISVISILGGATNAVGGFGFKSLLGSSSSIAIVGGAVLAGRSSPS